MADIEIEKDSEREGDIDPRVYEVGYLIIPALSDEEAPKEAQAIKEFIQSTGGTVISEEAPKHFTLAYTMYRTENGKQEKFETGHFGSIKFEIDPEGVLKIKEAFDGNKNILRYIIFKTVKENTRAEIRLPQVRVERRQETVAKPVLRKEEKDVPVSEEQLDKSIEELVVE